jgi:four helix bundle protein
MKSFEESIAWQRGMDLNVAVDKALANSRNFGFKDQLFRASLSICNNIAEGHEMPTVRNQLRYLWIAKGSCNEVHSMLILAQRREYFPPDVVSEMLSLQDEIARLLRTYIKKTSSGWDKIPGGLLLLGLWIKFTDPMVLP